MKRTTVRKSPQKSTKSEVTKTDAAAKLVLRGNSW